MTEDEARTKWCPMARVQIAESKGSNCNRVTTFPLDEHQSAAVGMCIASNCMLWVKERDRWYNLQERSEHGHCGLGSTP